MFLFTFVFLLSLLSVLVNNLIIWWSVFLMMTLLFVMINKSVMSYSSLLNYFVLQEVLGLLFLLLTFGFMQFLIVMLKIGVAPLHFWIFSVLNGVFGFNLMWFLTFQKLPFLLIILQLINYKMVFLLVLGLLMCMFQMLLMKSFKSLLILSSTESFNWIMLGVLLSFVNVIFVFFYYFFLMVFLIPKFEDKNVSNFLGWETMLVFMNMPFLVNFFVKIFSLSEVLKVYNFFVLMILLLMFMSVLSLSYWMINLSVKYNLSFKYNKVQFFVIFGSMFLIFL